MNLEAATLQRIADTARDGLTTAENWERVEALDAIIDILAGAGIVPRRGAVRPARIAGARQTQIRG